MYNTSLTTIYRIRNRLSNTEQTALFDAMTEDEQKALYEDLCKKHQLVQKKYDNMAWRKTQRAIDKETVFLIYIYQEYGNGKRCYIATDFGIKNDNVLRCIRDKRSYADCYEEYKENSLEQKLEILCHYMETYNRKPPELLENLVKARQSAAKPE